MKKAILSMDVEDWYHLDYFYRKDCNEKYSMLDGLYTYLEIIDIHKVPSNFFVLGELAKNIKNILREAVKSKHEIASHGWNHLKPMTLTLDEFRHDITISKNLLEDILGNEIIGYRAPCFSLDRERLEIVKEVGYKYDSSKIKFSNHPLYGELDMNEFEQVAKNIFKKNNFFEFEISTLKFFNKNIPISGGGYIRIFPWLLMKKMIGSYLPDSEIYIFYIHPFEFSKKNNTPYPKSANWNSKLRFSLGRNSVIEKFENLIIFLKYNNFEFTTFEKLVESLNLAN